MRLLIITNILTPYTIARYTAISKMKEVELSVLIQAKSEPNRTWNFDEYSNLDFSCNLLPGIHFNTGKKNLSFHFNYGIKKSIMKESPDVVIIVGWNNPTSYFTARACKKLGIPLIAWSGSTKNEPSLLRSLGSPAIRWLHRQCSAFVAYGTAAKELLVDHWGIAESKIFILGNPVDNIFFSRESKAAKKYNRTRIHDAFKNRKTVLYSGQLIERKGIHDLVVAFETVLKKHPDAHLVIAGKGKLRDNLMDYVKDSRSNNIHLIGHIDQDLLPRLYAHSTIFCLPSHEEVWGLVINEAMACGTPVVASDVCGACRDLIVPGKTGLVFKTGDPDDLAVQLLKLLENRALYERIKKQGMAHIKSWNIERLQKNIFKAIKFVLNKR